jgi:hypothetical protein
MRKTQDNQNLLLKFWFFIIIIKLNFNKKPTDRLPVGIID